MNLDLPYPLAAIATADRDGAVEPEPHHSRDDEINYRGYDGGDHEPRRKNASLRSRWTARRELPRLGRQRPILAQDMCDYYVSGLRAEKRARLDMDAIGCRNERG